MRRAEPHKRPTSHALLGRQAACVWPAPRRPHPPLSCPAARQCYRFALLPGAPACKENLLRFFNMDLASVALDWRRCPPCPPFPPCPRPRTPTLRLPTLTSAQAAARRARFLRGGSVACQALLGGAGRALLSPLGATGVPGVRAACVRAPPPQVDAGEARLHHHAHERVCECVGEGGEGAARACSWRPVRPATRAHGTVGGGRPTHAHMCRRSAWRGTTALPCTPSWRRAGW